MEKFNRDKAIKNIERKRNRNMYIKYGTFVFAICLGVFSITYMAYSKFISYEEYPFINVTVSNFTNRRVKAYLDGTYVDNSYTFLEDGTSTYTFTDTSITESAISATVSCTNGVEATINNFTLTLSDTTTKTKCSVYFKTTTE